ncbi:MAG: hypothetical protein V4813_17590 [Gemmatimonadota bacterium]
MRTLSILRATTALTLTLGLAACGDDAGAPTETSVAASVAAATTLDVATVAGDAATEDVETFKVNRGAFGLVQLADFERFGRWDPCPFDATTKRFVCVTRARGPFTYSRSYAYADGLGVAQDAYSATTTASANFKWALSGTITKRRWAGTMSRERDLTISGLLGANTTITINGTGAAERQRTRFAKEEVDGANAVEREYDMQGSTVIANVVTAAVRLPDTWPASGTITRTHTVTRTDARHGTRTSTRTSVVTFNGTQFVPLVVNGTEFTLDLATGTVTPKA